MKDEIIRNEKSWCIFKKLKWNANKRSRFKKKNNNVVSKDSLQFLDDLRANNREVFLDHKKDTIFSKKTIIN
jgi:hypothetical protein